MEDVSVIREPFSERTAVLADKNTNMAIVNILKDLKAKSIVNTQAITT